MISAFVVPTSPPASHDLPADLAAAGLRVTAGSDIAAMVEEVIRADPDVVLCEASHPDEALFALFERLDTTSPRPTVVFTSDPDADKIARAVRAGVHAYVVNGYAPARLRPVVHLAQARFRATQGLRSSLDDVRHRFAERKLVDRAKGILMRLRNLSEDEAYAVLRSAAMKSKRRIGQAAQQVIDAARYGEAVNRAGQLRMISQRLVQLYALMAAAAAGSEPRALFADSLALADANLASLGKTLSRATFGDLLDALIEPWQALKAALVPAPAQTRLAAIDALAERLLQQADQLTKTLEHAGFAAALRLINVSGRQRMLSQRFAKHAILAALRPGPKVEDDKERAAIVGAFAQAMTYLHAVPLTTPAIAAHLRDATATWAALIAVVPPAAPAADLRAVFTLSESLLATFEALTADYERNLQTLME